MELTIVGVAVSLLTQWLKKQFVDNEWVALAVVAVVSLLAAGAYVYLVDAGYWKTFYSILVTAGAFYAFIISRF